MTWWYSSLATMVLPSGATKASSAANGTLPGRLPAIGNFQKMCPALSTARMRPLPRSAISRPCGNGPAALAAAGAGEAGVAGDVGEAGEAGSPAAGAPAGGWGGGGIAGRDRGERPNRRGAVHRSWLGAVIKERGYRQRRQSRRRARRSRGRPRGAGVHGAGMTLGDARVMGGHASSVRARAPHTLRNVYRVTAPASQKAGGVFAAATAARSLEEVEPRGRGEPGGDHERHDHADEAHDPTSSSRWDRGCRPRGRGRPGRGRHRGRCRGRRRRARRGRVIAHRVCRLNLRSPFLHPRSP